MAIETQATLSGLVATIPSISTNQSYIVMFMAFKPLNTVTSTWERGITLGRSSQDIPYCRIRMRADNGLEGKSRNGANSGQEVTATPTLTVGTWKRVAMRFRVTDRMGIRAQGDSSLSQSSVADVSPFPGATIDKFRINTTYDSATFGEAGQYAHFGYYLGDWTDQQIADFCAGTWNPANSSLVTTYWTGDSLTPSVGTGTLADVGSNASSIVADTGHGVPDYSGGGAGVTLTQLERNRAALRGFTRGL